METYTHALTFAFAPLTLSYYLFLPIGRVENSNVKCTLGVGRRASLFTVTDLRAVRGGLTSRISIRLHVVICCKKRDFGLRTMRKSSFTVVKHCLVSDPHCIESTSTA